MRHVVVIVLSATVILLSNNQILKRKSVCPKTIICKQSKTNKIMLTLFNTAQQKLAIGMFKISFSAIISFFYISQGNII